MIVLLIMAFVMFGSSMGILYLGHKYGTPNTVLWALFPLIRGIHWLIECISNYYEEVLDIEMFILSRLELFTAFCSSFVLLAACIEHNGVIRRHYGKITILLASLLPLYLILTLSEETLEEFEDVVYFEGSVITSDPFRLSYGFILPLLAVIVIISTYFYYSYHAKKGKIFFNPKIKRATLILIGLILLFSIFEGFDYYEEYEEIEVIFIIFRAITLSFFIILPLIIILSQEFGLQKFLIIDHSGVPLFAYNFEAKSAILDDNISILTSGFISAIMGFSEELSSKETSFLSIQSHYLNYMVFKAEKSLYALQSILYNKNLENHFINATKEISKDIAKLDEISALDTVQMKKILDANFSIFF